MLKPETVQWLQRALQQGGCSRAGLARELCERDGWRNPRGKLCAASARKALLRLAEQLGLALPPAQAGVPACRRRGAQGPAPVQFAGSLRQLGEVRLERAQTPSVGGTDLSSELVSECTTAPRRCSPPWM